MAKKLKKTTKKLVKKPKKRVKVLKSKKKVKKIVRKIKKTKKIKKEKLIRKVKSKKIIRKRIKKAIKKKTVKKVKPRKIKKIRGVKRIRSRKRVVKKIKKPTKRKRVRRVKKTKPRIYIGKGVLEQLFESQAKVKLLKFFFRNSKDIFQPKEIFKRLRSNISLLRQEMNKLENIGVIKQKKAWLIFETTKRGRIRKEKKTVYYLNPAFDFVNELRNLILKSTISSKDDLVNSVRKLGNIKLLVLAGLFTGDEAAKADLLIVGDKINSRKLNNFIKDLEAEVGKELNCAIMSNREFSYRYDMYDRFVRDLLTGKSEILINRVNLW